jgi:hypothetical protein
MAGRPLKQLVVAELLSLAKESMGPEATALDYVCRCVESAESVADLGKRVGRLVDQEFGRPWFSTLIHDLEPDAKKRIMEARRNSAPHHVDAAQDELANAPTHDKIHFQKASEKAKLHLWLAERYGKADYGQQQQATNVNVFNVGEAHLAAFRALGTHSQIAPQSREVAPGPTIALLPVPSPTPTEETP